jgi:hypothetical protein
MEIKSYVKNAERDGRLCTNVALKVHVTRRADPDMLKVLAELRKEGRVKYVDGKKHVVWVDEPEDAPGEKRRVLSPEEAVVEAKKYLKSRKISSYADSVKAFGDGRRTFMLKIRACLWRIGKSWESREIREEFARMCDYVELAPEKRDSLLGSKITLHDIGQAEAVSHIYETIGKVDYELCTLE